MQADLHLHSIYSDGLYSPDELCRKAKSRGLSLVSITDHDTLVGDEVKRAAARRHGLQYVSGWEISAYDGGQKIHILGYACEMGEAYVRFMNERKNAAFARAEDSVRKLRALGIPVSMEAVLAERSSEELPVHTMHVARAVGKCVGILEGEAYLRYLAYGKPANSGIGRPTPEEAIDCIHACGGFAAIAHPGRLTMSDVEKENTVKRLAAYGADGIEAVYTTHTDKETEYFRALGAVVGLLVTGGSDTHFEDGTRVVGTPVFFPSEELLEKLRVL